MSRVAFAGSKTTTAECIERFIRDGFSADLLVTLTPDLGARHDVAGYADLRPFAAQHGIAVYHPRSTPWMTTRTAECGSRASRSARSGCTARMSRCRAVADVHRSTGRSPGARHSCGHTCFRYDAGVDSGAIVGAQRFDITVWDDCETLHFMNTLAMNRLLREYLPEVLAGNDVYKPQPTDIEPTYLPKRTPEHGRIRWSDLDMLALYNHIRCQTRPFLGAFSQLDGSPERFFFWRGLPFDSHLTYPDARPGTVVEVFHDGSFLVAVWDGTVRVDDYTVGKRRTAPPVGSRFVDEPLDSPPGA